jgi:hypothetical protein
MITVQITGGLGNQLFQYCSAKALSLHKGVPLNLDLSYFEATGKKDDLRFFHIPEKAATQEEMQQYTNRGFIKKAFQKMLPRTSRDIYKEPFFHYDPSFFHTKKQVLVKGLRQSEKYFSNYFPQIRELLRIREDAIHNVTSIAQELKAVESVAIHIRRGDYLTQVALDVLGIMEKEYYLRSFELIRQKIQNPTVYYFSDDIEWVKEELLPMIPGTLMSQQQATNHIEDFYLMSQCRHNIIANSSFSWWAAWLNDNPGKTVVAPARWFNVNHLKDTPDLIPATWIRQ